MSTVDLSKQGMQSFETVKINSNSDRVHLLDETNKSQQNDDKKATEGFRVKKAANIALLALAATLAAVVVAATATAVVLTFVVTSIIPVIIASVVAATAATALIILGLLKAWEKVTPHLPNFLRIPANYLQSSVTGVASAAALAVIWPWNMEKSNPKPEEINPDQPLRIGIHGFCGSSNNWAYHRGRFKEAGIDNFATINLGNWFLGIDDYVEKLHNMLVDYKKGMIEAGKLRTDEELQVQFICHSMGGLVARHYNQKYSEKDGVHVSDICTLGTPLDGTKVAYLAAPSKAGRQMFHSSEFVKNQQKKAASENTHTRFFNIASRCDYVIRPLVSATESNTPKDRTKEKWLDATGHISYLFSDAAAKELVNYLDTYKFKVTRAEAAV